MRSAGCRACDNLLWENHTYCTQSHSTCQNPTRGCLVKQRDDTLDDCWDFSVCQKFVWRISVGSVSGRIYVTSVSSYQRIAFWIAYGINQFFWIAYGVNQFLGIGVCRIADCWLDRKYLELFYRFCMNVRSNLSLICHIWILPLCIYCDELLKQSIHRNVLDVMFGIFFFLFHFCHDSANCFLKLFSGQWCAVTINMTE